jgi:hypothetical protein
VESGRLIEETAMGVLETISAHPVVQEPGVWISRLVIFETVTGPQPKMVRDIHFTRGLNIIWAKEDDGESPDEGIGGHSAGKTTLCRFIRYVLGEATVGTKQNVDLLRRAFPEGCVAAEIHVAGRLWAVRRPFGRTGRTYVLPDATIEKLLEERGQIVSQEEYSAKIGLDGLLDTLATKTVIRTNEQIKWGHILSWCTRDQETRFQSLHEWRSSRSDHESPIFKFSKAGPLFVIRAALGLFNADEITLEGRVAAIQRSLDDLEKQVEDKRREPHYLKKSFTEQLLRRLASAFPNESNLDKRPFRWPKDNTFRFEGQDLEALAKQRIQHFLAESERLEGEAAEIQQQIDERGEERGRLVRREKSMALSVKVDSSAIGEIDGAEIEADEARELQAFLQSIKDEWCDYGDISCGECEYVQARVEPTNISEEYNKQANEDERSERCSRICRLNTKLEEVRRELTNIKLQIDKLKSKGNDYRRRAQAFREQAQGLEWIIDELARWIAFSENPGNNSEFSALHVLLSDAKAEHDRLNEELHSLSLHHRTGCQLLVKLFTAIVHAVLRSDKFYGIVNLNKDGEVQFRIANGPAMSGEAIETLAVLLSDITSAMYSVIRERGCHPRFLLHDSPHEADLAGSIYRSFIRTMANFHEELGGSESAPFQYILTTTSAPPSELQGTDSIKLNLSAPNDMLLRCDIRDAVLGAAEASSLF